MDPDFAEVLHETGSDRRSSLRQAERKTRQFCRQVQLALNIAFADCGGMQDLFAEEVSPAPDCGRLLVHVAIPPGRPVADAIAVLGAQTARLRAEVAATISRKRTPQLFFAPVDPAIPLDGGSDE
ncbi:MAG: hypothetical protein R2762_12775 [Bryobacteraceae bacterium]